MRKLYFAFTQLHLLYLVNLKRSIHVEDDVDIIILNSKYTGTDRVIHHLKNSQLFSRILMLENNRAYRKGVMKISAHIQEMKKAYSNKKQIYSFIDSAEDLYDEFFTFGSNMEAYIAFDYISRNGKVKFNYYEEGIGTYIHPFTNMLKPWNRYFLQLNHIKMPTVPDEVWVYMPKWLSEERIGDITVKMMPKIKDIDFINSVWEYHSNRIDEDIILFEQPIPQCDDVLSDLFHRVNSEDVMIKMHPRSNSRAMYNDMKVMETGDSIWELICINNDMEDKLLVSLCSTTCFTAKYLNNSEPWIIFLFKIKELNFENNDKMERMVQLLRDSYKCSEKILVPSNIAEYTEAIEKYRIMVHNKT